MDLLRPACHMPRYGTRPPGSPRLSTGGVPGGLFSAVLCQSAGPLLAAELRSPQDAGITRGQVVLSTCPGSHALSESLVCSGSPHGPCEQCCGARPGPCPVSDSAEPSSFH